MKPGDVWRCPDCGGMFKVIGQNLLLARHHARSPEGQRTGSLWCKGSGRSALEGRGLHGAEVLMS